MGATAEVPTHPLSMLPKYECFVFFGRHQELTTLDVIEDTVACAVNASIFVSEVQLTCNDVKTTAQYDLMREILLGIWWFSHIKYCVSHMVEDALSA